MITTWILFAFVGGQFWVVGSDYPTKSACLEDAKIVNTAPEKDKNGVAHLAKCYPVTSQK